MAGPPTNFFPSRQHRNFLLPLPSSQPQHSITYPTCSFSLTKPILFTSFTIHNFPVATSLPELSAINVSSIHVK
ncbi:hypothetical protein E2C01_023419 [Portunus trituberculatus]|uniref:Uncharacterized protein n=1 Tax=Portunus trituberculatus TaxID=210409 RepID=A0A5B7E7X3_PORTR|nr:hypothetical protein [Portunus trituberculatus]